MTDWTILQKKHGCVLYLTVVMHYLLLQRLSNIIHRGLFFPSCTAFCEVTCVLEPDQIHTLGMKILLISDGIYYHLCMLSMKHWHRHWHVDTGKNLKKMEVILCNHMCRTPDARPSTWSGRTCHKISSLIIHAILSFAKYKNYSLKFWVSVLVHNTNLT